MKAFAWEDIDNFNDWAEFEQFRAWIASELESGVAISQPAVQSYRNLDAFKEEWFEHTASKEVWRLVWPDPPFAGIFEKVVHQQL